jgi:hypothetical protein
VDWGDVSEWRGNGDSSSGELFILFWRASESELILNGQSTFDCRYQGRPARRFHLEISLSKFDHPPREKLHVPKFYKMSS